MLKLSKAAEMVEEWVEMLTGYCEIVQVEKTTPDNSYRFLVYEDEYDPITFIVTDTGRMLNVHGEDIVEGMEKAYEGYADANSKCSLVVMGPNIYSGTDKTALLERIKQFKETWYE